MSLSDTQEARSEEPTCGTIYFLVGPVHPEITYNDSYVIPLSDPKNIEIARKLISGEIPYPYYPPVCSLKWGSSEFNRDHFAPGAPQWPWHPIKFQSWGTATREVAFSPPSLVENSRYWSAGTGIILLHQAIGYNVVRELGPHPCISLSIEIADGSITLSWNDLGVHYRYRVEVLDQESGRWTAAPGGSWPIRENTWSESPSNGQAAFYRVLADLRVPEE